MFHVRWLVIDISNADMQKRGKQRIDACRKAFNKMVGLVRGRR